MFELLISFMLSLALTGGLPSNEQMIDHSVDSLKVEMSVHQTGDLGYGGQRVVFRTTEYTVEADGVVCVATNRSTHAHATIDVTCGDGAATRSIRVYEDRWTIRPRPTPTPIVPGWKTPQEEPRFQLFGFFTEK